MVEGAVKSRTSSDKMERCSLAQFGQLGGQIKAETDIAELRGKKGSLPPRQQRLSLERGSRAKAKLSHHCRETLQEQSYLGSRSWTQDGKRETVPPFLETQNALCDLLTSPSAPRELLIFSSL